MKYHSSASTIAISLAVLAAFLSLCFCLVFCFHFSSPGEIIIGQIESSMPEGTGLEISYEGMDRLMDRSIMIHGLSVKKEGIVSAYAESVKVYSSPIAIVKALILKEGRIDVDIANPKVTLDSSLLPKGTEKAGGGSSFSAATLDDMPSLLGDSPLLSLEYSINLNGLSLSVGDDDILGTSDAYIRLSEGLKAERMSFVAPSMKLTSSSLSFSTGPVVATLDRDGEGYVASASAEDISCLNESFSASSKLIVLSATFEGFSSLNADYSGYAVSAEDVALRSGDVSFSTGKAFVSGGAKEAFVSLESTDVKYGSFSFSVPSLSSNIAFGGTLDGSFSFGGSLACEKDGENLFVADGCSASFSNGEMRSIGIKASSISTGALGKYGIEKAIANDIDFSFRENEGNLYSELSGKVLVESGNRHIDGISADVFSYYMKSDGIIQASAEATKISFPFLDETFDVVISEHGDDFSGSIRSGEKLSSSFSFGRKQQVSLDFQGVRLMPFMAIIEDYAPQFRAYVTPETALSGSLSLIGTGEKIYENRLSGSVALSNINYRGMSFGLASSIEAKSDEESVQVESFNVTSEWVRAAFSGVIKYSTRMPEGVFDISVTDSGEKLLSIDFDLSEDSEYTFYARIPRYSRSYMRGTVNWAEDKLVRSDGELKSGVSVYPFLLSINLGDSVVRLSSVGLTLGVNFNFPISVSLLFDNFEFPVPAEDVLPMVANGRFSYEFDVERQEQVASIEKMELRNIRYLPSSPSLSFSMSLENNEISFDGISFADSFGTMDGSAKYSGDRKSFAMALSGGGESFDMSVLSGEGDRLSGLLELRGMNLSRYGIGGMRMDAVLTGRGNSLGDFSFSGNVDATGEDGSSAHGEMVLTERELVFRDLEYRSGLLTATLDSIAISPFDGRFILNGDFTYLFKNHDRDYPIDLSVRVESTFRESSSLFDAVASYRDLTSSMRTRIEIERLSIDNGRHLVRNRHIDVKYGDGVFQADGDLINAQYDMATGDIEFKLFDNEIFTLDCFGYLSRESADLDIRELSLDLGALNSCFPYPIVLFSKGSWVSLEGKLTGPLKRLDIYANLSSKDVVLDVWWLRDDYIKIGDLEASLYDCHMISSRIPIMTVNKTTGEVKKASAVLEANLDHEKVFKNFSVTVYIPDDNPVYVSVPLEGYNLQFSADTTGVFKYMIEMGKNYLSGDLHLDNCVMSLGHEELPYWWHSGMGVRNDFHVTIGENGKLLVPLSEDPIVSASFKSGTSFDFIYDNETFERAFDGTIYLKGGEIYYFDKNFYIEDGSLSFRKNYKGDMIPSLNLRALLRDFDSSGDKVNIYLILRNAGLEDFEPMFESSPQKSQEEIMSILSETILTRDDEGDLGYGSVVSLVSSGVGAMGRFGLFGSSGSTLGRTIRSSLRLDQFTVRTAIVRNLILDSMVDDLRAYTPIARYLMDTTLYAGKYIRDDLFFQALLHLDAANSRDRLRMRNYNTFLSEDLYLDLELSLEWQNPIGAVTFFSHPSAFRLYNAFDRFGITFSKRIQF